LVTSNRASPGTSKGFPPHQSALLVVVAQYLLETFRGGQGFGDGHGYGRSRRLTKVGAEDAAQAEGSWRWEQKTLRVFDPGSLTGAEAGLSSRGLQSREQPEEGE